MPNLAKTSMTWESTYNSLQEPLKLAGVIDCKAYKREEEDPHEEARNYLHHGRKLGNPN